MLDEICIALPLQHLLLWLCDNRRRTSVACGGIFPGPQDDLDNTAQLPD
jgi:hypothetical protein